MRTLLTALTALMLLSTPVVAGDWVDAFDAYKAGDYQKAYRLFKPLAEQGDAKGQYNLGYMYSKGKGVTQDYVKAVQWYSKAAEQGNANAEFNLGVMYDKGEGVPEDDTKAIHWYRKAAEQGKVRAQNALGYKYAYANVFPKAIYYVKAYAWLSIAAAQGHESAEKIRAKVEGWVGREKIAEAQKLSFELWKKYVVPFQKNLGLMYANGEGVPEDAAKAVHWYRKAVEQGLAQAQANLGVMYDKGEGVPEDDTKAVHWYRKAAEQGHPNAQYNLGLKYAIGEGIPRGYVQAYAWWSISAARGLPKAKHNKVMIREMMALEQIKEAARLALDYYTKYVEPFQTD